MFIHKAVQIILLKLLNLKWADNIPVQLCWLLASSWPQNELLPNLEGLRKKDSGVFDNVLADVRPRVRHGSNVMKLQIPEDGLQKDDLRYFTT